MEATSRYIPHYTVAEWERWADRWELWHGVPVMLPSPIKIHNLILDRMVSMVRGQLETKDECRGCHVVREIDWRMEEDLVVCPDLSIICGEDDDRYITRTPTFIAEVLSPSTQIKDRNQKRVLYQERGVEFYALIDPVGEQFRIIRFVNGKETSHKPDGDGRFQIDLPDGCHLTLDPGAVWTS